MHYGLIKKVKLMVSESDVGFDLKNIKEIIETERKKLIYKLPFLKPEKYFALLGKYIEKIAANNIEFFHLVLDYYAKLRGVYSEELLEKKPADLFSERFNRCANKYRELNNLETRIKNVIKEKTEINFFDFEKIDTTTNLAVYLDSLQTLDVIIGIEKEFNIKIPSWKIRRLNTIRRLMNYITRCKTKEKIKPQLVEYLKIFKS